MAAARGPPATDAGSPSSPPAPDPSPGRRAQAPSTRTRARPSRGRTRRPGRRTPGVSPPRPRPREITHVPPHRRGRHHRARCHRRRCRRRDATPGGVCPRRPRRRRLVGLLTERDLVQVIVDGDDPAVDPRPPAHAHRRAHGQPRHDDMQARELMGRHALRHLPVVEDGEVVGLIEQTEPRTGINFGSRRASPTGPPPPRPRRRLPRPLCRRPAGRASTSTRPTSTGSGWPRCAAASSSGGRSPSRAGSLLRRRLRLILRRESPTPGGTPPQPVRSTGSRSSDPPS